MNTANPIPTPSTPHQSARALLKEFQKEFKVMRECMPLAIGVDKQLFERFPDISRRTLRTVLGIHTNSTRYLKGMATATARFDLEGNPAGEVEQAHLDHAAKSLKERLKKDAERRKAQRAVEDAQRVVEEAQRKEDLATRQRQEKLQQLTAKFSRGNK